MEDLLYSTTVWFEFDISCVCFVLSCVFISQTSLPSEWIQASCSLCTDQLKSRLLRHVGCYLCSSGFLRPYPAWKKSYSCMFACSASLTFYYLETMPKHSNPFFLQTPIISLLNKPFVSLQLLSLIVITAQPKSFSVENPFRILMKWAALLGVEDWMQQGMHD